MKERLELKHLAPYLPYKLMIYDSVNQSQKVMNMGQGTSNNWVGIKTVLNYSDIAYKDGKGGIYKPILRPLSDLTKEIDYKGMHGIRNLMSDHKLIMKLAKSNNINSIEDLKFYYGNVASLKDFKDVFNTLMQFHFDMDGWIEKGLAIDINTLKNLNERTRLAK